MVIYLFAVDLGLNGHEIVSVHTEPIDPQAEFKRWNDDLTERGQMHPYTTGYAQWRIDTETHDVTELP